MNTIFITLLCLIYIQNASSQIVTFDKTLPASSAAQVIHTDDNGYLIYCQELPYTPVIMNFVKVDQFGYIEWMKEYPELIGVGEKLCKTLDGGYAAVAYKNKIGEYGNIWLVKFNNQLDTVWTKTYSLPQYEGSGQSIIQLPDSSFIISFVQNSKFFLMKTDASGSLIWSKETLNIPSIFPSYLINLNDGTFLFGTTSTITRMSSEADTIWTKRSDGIRYGQFTNDNNILVSSQTYIKKYDINGNQIWQRNIGDIRFTTQTASGHYAILQGKLYGSSTISLMDTSGNIVLQNSFKNYGKFISPTSDNGLIICGTVLETYNPRCSWLLKTDKNLEHTSINFIQPTDGSELYIFNTYSIKWDAKNINYVDIDYSVDNRNNWTSIVKYYPASSGIFNWELTDIPIGNIFIRIIDSFNSSVYDRSDPPQKTFYYKATDYIAANEIFMWIGNNGMGSHDPRTDGSGFYWPGGEDATISAIFEDGLVWGGKVDGEVRVNGSTYRQGLLPGYIMTDGKASSPYETKSKIFKLKKNWQMLPLGLERDRYVFDYENWPVDVGAPWEDKNGDGIYTRGIDEPKIIGDETLFFVANDLDTSTSKNTYGSDPFGLEIQCAVFGYNTELLKDVVFKKYKVINKSSSTISEMYFSYWTDDDLGYASDDYVGCDTVLNLGYTYNGDNIDEYYYGTPPPAVGHVMLQTPIIQSEPTDSARYGDGWVKGLKNIPLSAFLIMIDFAPGFDDAEYGIYSGTLKMYNFMQGLLSDGTKIIDPVTNSVTRFFLYGDPVLGTGWYEGDGWPGGSVPDDRRFMLTSGPFNMAPKDTQEVVIAILIKQGTDNLNSITELKNYAAQIQHWYDNDFVTSVKHEELTVPLEYSLSQNYPNPFNPTTKIRFTIPENPPSSPFTKGGNGYGRGGFVTLKVYDVLGNEVTTLVNEEKPAGNYEVEFNGSKLSSGVYFYRLKAGTFVKTKKMIYLK